MSQEYPLVTVLVPVYNVERYLRHCLDTLARQTYRNLQIICLDDGSTDSCPKILREYAQLDGRIEVVTKDNSGYGSSMNIGLRRARGEYVGILESDDFAEPTMFEELARLAVATDADVVKSNYFQHSDGQSTNEDVYTNNIADGVPLETPFSPLDNHLGLLSSSAIWSCLFKRSHLEENRIAFLETPGAVYQDTSFNLKALITARTVVFTRQAYVHYRIDNPGSSVRSASKLYYICDEYHEVWRYLKEDHPLLFDAFAPDIVPIQFRGYEWNLGRVGRRYKEQFFERFRSELKGLEAEGLLSRGAFSAEEQERVRALLYDPARSFASWCGALGIRKTVLVSLYGGDSLQRTDIAEKLDSFVSGRSQDEEIIVDDTNASEAVESCLVEMSERDARVRLMSALRRPGKPSLDVTDLRGDYVSTALLDLSAREVFVVRTGKALAKTAVYKKIQSVVERVHR